MLKKEIILYLDGRTAYEICRDIIICSVRAHEIDLQLIVSSQNRNIGKNNKHIVFIKYHSEY